MPALVATSTWVRFHWAMLKLGAGLPTSRSISCGCQREMVQRRCSRATGLLRPRVLGRHPGLGHDRFPQRHWLHDLTNHPTRRQKQTLCRPSTLASLRRCGRCSSCWYQMDKRHLLVVDNHAALGWMPARAPCSPPFRST